MADTENTDDVEETSDDAEIEAMLNRSELLDAEESVEDNDDELEKFGMRLFELAIASIEVSPRSHSNDWVTYKLLNWK